MLRLPRAAAESPPMTEEALLPLPRPKAPHTTCDACGHAMAKAHKRYRNKAICGSCYARWFKSTLCTRCGKTTRAYHAEASPLCPACVRQTRACLRCHRPVPRAGLLIGGQAVCPSCSPHYREARPCAQCGEFSRRLSRVRGAAPILMCERCQRRLTSATCSRCGKHRKVRGRTQGDEPVCMSCLSTPASEHPCPECGGMVRGADQSRPCRDCGFKRAWRRKTQALLALFGYPSIRSLWVEFGDWVLAQNRVSLGLTRAHHYAAALGRVEGSMTNAALAIDDSLLQVTFTPEECRRAGLFSAFLAATGRMSADAGVRAERADEGRIDKILATSLNHDWHGRLAKYAASLEAHVPPLAVRTRRLYLRAAAGLLESSGVAQVQQLTTDHIASYLRATPGQRNSLASWLDYLAETLGLQLALPKAERRHQRTPDEIAGELAELIEEISRPNSSAKRLAALASALALAYGVPLETILNLREEDLAADVDTVQLRLGGAWLTMDPRLAGWARWFLIDSTTFERHLRRRLFPGRIPGDALSTSAVRYHLAQR